MTEPRRRVGGVLACAWLPAFVLAWLAACPAVRATAADPPVANPVPPYRVLVLSSFGSGFEIFSPMISVFRNELTHIQGGAVDFFDVPLELARFDDADGQEPFVGYLAALFASRRPDLVVTLGGPAASFAQTYRARLFPDTPLLLASVESRIVDAAQLGPRDAVVPVVNDLAAVPAMALELLPKTEHLAIVLGSAPLERFWRDQLARALAPLEGRVQLIWLDGLPVDELLARVATLPPHTAVYFVMVLLDGAGVPQFQNRVLTRLRKAANAPIFGLFDSQVGLGVVGGGMLPMTLLGQRTAEAAARLLAGAAPADVRYPPIAQVSQVFDSRELLRWGIPESRLPAGGEVRFRPESPWRIYRWQILGFAALLGLETSLIAFLIIHRARRRIAEKEIRALHGRLLATYEQERRRLARELHDDLTQRLARLAIDAAQVERQNPALDGNPTLGLMREELVRLSDDVHTLSRQLHPSILDELGLADALRSEGERFARTEQVEVDLRLAELPAELASETALCLFRVAQEALRNVAHHARARRVAVVLHSADGTLELGVSDDGVGFDPGARRAGSGLGHVSLRERLQLVGGRLEITSVPGGGTIVLARVPLAGDVA
jgi:signal transduction histidine kinase